MKKLSQAEFEGLHRNHEEWLRSSRTHGLRADIRSRDLRDLDFSGKGASPRSSKAIDLKDAQLQGANLSGLVLSGANFDGADLTRANLSGADLREAKLRGAKLCGAKLEGANLDGANLEQSLLTEANLARARLQEAKLARCRLDQSSLHGADLEKAELDMATLVGVDFRKSNLTKAEFCHNDPTFSNGADLTDADMRGAKLCDANLAGVIGLRSDRLGGADLSNAKLPQWLREFDSLEHVAEVSKSARTVFLAVIAGCFFCWLTIGTTTDAALIANNAGTPLPIIQTELPIVGFFMIAPLILLALYVYLHMYAQRLWVGLGGLPARFVDGKSLDERAYPWLLTSLVRLHVPLLCLERPPLWWLQIGSSYLAAWGLVPITLLAFFARYLPTRDTNGAIWLIILSTAAVWLAVSTLLLSRYTLAGRLATTSGVTYRAATLAAVCVAAALTIVVLISAPYKFWVFTNYANIRGQFISVPPENWRDISENYELIVGAEIWGINLEYAQAEGAFLDKARIGPGKLRHSNFSGARFRGAVLDGADLSHSNFSHTGIEGASLQGAKLTGSDFSHASVLNADLTGADLTGADFFGANLFGTELDSVRLNGASLIGSNISQEQLDGACGDNETVLPSDQQISNCD